MGTMLTATFGTRREAEITIERLVQKFGIDRGAVSVSTEDDENCVGEKRAGSDDAAGQPGQDAASAGAIVVTAEIEDEDTADQVRAAFGEFGAEGVV